MPASKSIRPRNVTPATAGPVARRKNAAVKRANIWAVPSLMSKLLLSLLLKESPLELTFNADEPFFRTSGTVPTKIMRFGL
jgi:hypothetical protein